MINKSTFGNLFRTSTFGESHGRAIGVVIDGCPAGLALDEGAIQAELQRRRPGQSKLVSPRKEKDEFEIYSGVFEGKTTGTPIMAMVINGDAKSKDYGEIKDLFRPGHADLTYFAKYGHRDYRGGGRSSARETIARVIAGAIAKQLLRTCNIEFKGGVTQVGEIKAERYCWDTVDNNDVKCVDPDVVSAMEEAINAARKDRDSLGGIVEVRAEGAPMGLGEPIFSKLDAQIAAAMMSIPAAKGVEFGGGFSCVTRRGSDFNDELLPNGFSKNDHGGILGGLSSGAPIVVRIAIKATSSIAQEQRTVDKEMMPCSISTKGRHDPCVAIRAVPIAEAMLALVLVDAWLEDKAQAALRENFSPRKEISFGLASEEN